MVRNGMVFYGCGMIMYYLVVIVTVRRTQEDILKIITTSITASLEDGRVVILKNSFWQCFNNLEILQDEKCALLEYFMAIG